MTPTALEIIKQYLIDNDYDGLANETIECGCELSDLQPCGSDFSQCKPAYKYVSTHNTLSFLMHEEKQDGRERIK